MSLSKSLNLAQQKPALAGGVSATYHKFRSQNSSYGPDDVISISIPCGQNKAQYLLPSESYLEFDLTATLRSVSGGTASVSIDNSIYSMMRAVRVWHGSSLLVEHNHAGRLYNALFDFNRGHLQPGACLAYGASANGFLDGRLLTIGALAADAAAQPPIKFAVPIPAPIVGPLTSTSVPLGLMSASDLRIEIVLVPPNQLFTTSLSTNAAGGIEEAQGLATTQNPVFTYTVSNIFYNAKICTLSSDLHGAMMASFGGAPISIPSTSWSCEQSFMPVTSAFNMKLNAQYSSLKSVFWYAINQAISLGTPAAFNVSRANCRYAGGKLRSFYLNIAGETVPSDRHIAVGRVGATALTPLIGEECDFHASVPFQALARCFNASTSADFKASFHPAQYATSVSSEAKQRECIGKFLSGFDLERSDGDGSDIVYQGINTRNSTIDLFIEYLEATAAAQIVFAMAHYDVTFVLDQGTLIKAD